MTAYTVQCGYAAYYANTMQLEAESLEAALEQAIEKANDDPHWKALDHCGPTFVDAVAEGADADPWSGFISVLLIPDRFTEQGEPPTVTVIIEGGLVQDVVVEGGTVHVLVKDYDTEGLDPESTTSAATTTGAPTRSPIEALEDSCECCGRRSVALR